MKKQKKWLVIALILLLSTGSVYAQETFYRVYQFETPLQGHLQLNLWDTHIGKSDLDYGNFNKTISREGLFGHAFEAEVGITDHFSLSFYGNFEAPKGSPLQFSETRLEGVYRIGERFDHFINLALYAEYYYPSQSFSKSQEAEVRLIMDKDVEDFRLVLNPTVSKYTTGNKGKAFQPAVLSAVYYRRFKFIQPGAEFYSNFYQHNASIFPTIDLRFGPYITWNMGAGFGLNKNSDKFAFKSILQFDIPLIRPSNLLRKNGY